LLSIVDVSSVNCTCKPTNSLPGPGGPCGPSGPIGPVHTLKSESYKNTDETL